MGYILLAAAIVAADQWFKAWFVAHVAALEGARLIPGVLGLTLVHNFGASWGILSGKTDFLLVLTGLVCAGVFVVLLLGRPRDRLGRLALALVLGGAIGNAVDRMLLGYVVDMFQTLFMDFPIFNIADCFITVGGGLFCLSIILEERQERQRRIQRQAAREARRQREADTQAAEASLDEILQEFQDHDHDA